MITKNAVTNGTTLVKKLNSKRDITIKPASPKISNKAMITGVTYTTNTFSPNNYRDRFSELHQFREKLLVCSPDINAPSRPRFFTSM